MQLKIHILTHHLTIRRLDLPEELQVKATLPTRLTEVTDMDKEVKRKTKMVEW